MIRGKYYKKVVIEGKEIEDVIVMPKILLENILKYRNPLLQEPYNSLTDYGKGVIDTIKEQHSSMSINTDW